MFEIAIEVENGYFDKDVKTWRCPLCSFKIERNLSFDYVAAAALSHLVDTHIAKFEMLKVVRVEKGVKT